MTDKEPSEKSDSASNSPKGDAFGDGVEPQPKGNRFSTLQAIGIMFVIAVVFTIGKWYYDNQVIPFREIPWRKYDEAKASEDLASGRRLAILCELDRSIETIELLDQIESPEVRKLLYQNGFVPLRTTDQSMDDVLLALTSKEDKQDDDTLGDSESEPSPESGLVLVYEQGESVIDFPTPLEDPDAIRIYLHDLRFGKSKSKED